MKEVFKVPVILTKSDDFGEVLYDAQGTGEYWDIMSDVYETPVKALNDIHKLLLPILQTDLDTYKQLFLTKEEDIFLDKNQKVVYLGFELNK